MKKKIIFSIILVIMLAVSYTAPSMTHTNDCFAKAKSKYVKIKKTVWKEYKEGYTVTLPAYKKKVASLNKTVKSQKTTIANKNKTIASKDKTIASQKTVIQNNSKTISDQKVTIANQKAQISDQKLQISDLNATIKDKKSTISWLWKQLEAFGYFYNYDTHQWEPTETTAEESQPTVEEMNMSEDTSEVDIIEADTGLHVESIKLMDRYGEWAAYYVQADGDLYVITVGGGAVDVCSQLN